MQCMDLLVSQGVRLGWEVAMLYDALFALALPSTEGPPLPTGWVDGLERLLFTGRWARRTASCSLASATVLARCHGALREWPHTGLAVDGDADELLSVRIADARGEPEPWAERLPRRWTTEPCDFRLRTGWATEHLHVALTVRYTPRHEPEVGALTGALRAAWVVPEREDLARDLAATFDDDDALLALYRLVSVEGARTAEGVLSALRASFDTDGELRGRTVVPVGERLVELLAGLPDRATVALPAVAEAARSSGRWWPALDDGGVPGWLGRDRLVTTAEVTDAL